LLKIFCAEKFLQVIGRTALEVPGYADAISVIVSEAEKAELLIRMEGPKGTPVFGLNPEAFHITSSVGKMRCAKCGQLLSVPKGTENIWRDVACLRKDCGGHYEPAEEAVDVSYHIYGQGEPIRIHAGEHSSLLQRQDREALEEAFKHGKEAHHAWDPNLLSCTPTLEMGIDIGDLSTVVLCQVPPGQAQYIQRVGRAGRKDGNAFAVTIAGTKQHDLYFYQEPTEMISGSVEPPAVFLNASAVLERQFMAFCFDCWVKSGIDDGAVPDTIKRILSHVDKDVKPVKEFPFNLLHYMHSNMSRLERRFVGMFGEKLEEDTKNSIHSFVIGEGDENPEHRLLTPFTEVKKDRDRLQDDIKKLKKAIEDLDALPKDSSFEAQKKELYDERNALLSVVDKMNDKNTFNFLSDEGVLPNYAFPEAGVTLKAVLTHLNSFRSAARAYVISPTKQNATALKAAAQALADEKLCREAAKCLTTDVFALSGRLAGADDKLKNAFMAFQQKILDGKIDVASLSKSVGSAYKNMEVAADRLIGLGKELNAKSGEKYFVSSAVLDVFKGEMSLSSLLESRVHGYEDSDVNIALDDKNVVESKSLGAGNFNTVTLVKVKDGSEWVFKPELAGRLTAPNSTLNDGLDANQEMTRVNLAVQTSADTLGLGDVMVKTSAGTHKGQFGMFMEKAPGVTGRQFKKNITEK